jgi:RNA polymerase sigma-70 factor (ECF subfamily)
MEGAALESLLERLNAGDGTAVEQVVAAYEPFLRLLVRRHCADQLRAKFDSVDVVQSVWAHMLRALRAGTWRIADDASLRALLATVARRRLISRARHHHPAVSREQPGGGEVLDVLPAADQPRPSEVVQADDLREKMLTLCPPAHRELLHLKRQGVPLEEISAQTGLHEGSVRRVLRRLARQLALVESPCAAAPEPGAGGPVP